MTYSVTVTVKEAKTIHATISMQAENMFIMVPTRVEVSSDLAERYGYADDVTDGVSALDVLVKYHELTFGEDFTKDSKSDYLVVSNGTITTVNGEKTSAFSFAVNGEFPCDKNGEYNTQYGYTGYTISQTPVAEDGTVEFFFYQDTSMYMDYYTWFTVQDGNRLDTFTVQAGTDFTLGMDGYMYAYGGGLKPRRTRVTHGAALDPEDIQICTVGEDGTLTPVEGKVIGEKGRSRSRLPPQAAMFCPQWATSSPTFSPRGSPSRSQRPRSPAMRMSTASLSQALRPLLARTTPTPLPSPTARTLQRAAL